MRGRDTSVGQFMRKATHKGMAPFKEEVFVFLHLFIEELLGDLTVLFKCFPLLIEDFGHTAFGLPCPVVVRFVGDS